MNKKRTPKTLQKPLPIVDTVNTHLNAQNMMQFELELCWCIQQLEQSLSSGKFSQKQTEEATRNLKTLKSSTVPLIKKRQLMKTLFGDYRTKMKEEEKKLGLIAKQVKFTTNANAQSKSSFVKKSAILTSGRDFRFNFETKENAENNDSKQSTNGLIEETKQKLNFSSDSTFKFNFNIDENDDIDLKSLKI